MRVMCLIPNTFWMPLLMSKKLIIAAAGSGKTTHLVDEALKQEDGLTRTIPGMRCLRLGGWFAG